MVFLFYEKALFLCTLPIFSARIKEQKTRRHLLGDAECLSIQITDLIFLNF